MYGWYSLNAYNSGHDEYVYINPYGQETYCTATSTTKQCPYPPNSTQFNDCIFMGKIKYYSRKIIN